MKYLFVCTGNTCRSPMAQAIAKKYFKNDEFYSAGIAVRSATKVSSGAVNALKHFEIDISDQTSTPLTFELLNDCDYIIPMTSNHKAILLSYGVEKDKILSFDEDIIDPYMCNDDVYLQCANIIKHNIFKLFNKTDIIELGIENLNDVLTLENTCFSTPQSKENTESSLKNEKYKYIGFVKERNIVGYCSVFITADEAYINNIAVLPKERQKGVGSALLSDILRFCKNMKCSFITLEVRESNSKAIKLYEKFGFEDVGTRKNYYNNPIENAKLMTKYFGDKNENFSN